MELAVAGERHHHLRYPEGQAVAPIDLPEVHDLAVGLGDLVEVLALDGARDARHEEDAALHLVLVRVPEPLLVVGQRQEERLRDHVLEPDEAAVLAGPVVDEALPELLVLVGAEVVGLHLPAHVVPIEMETDNNQS